MRLFHLEATDSRQLAQELQDAEVLVRTCCGDDLLSGSQHDLPLLQQVIENIPAPVLDTEQVQALAAALGRVLLQSQPGSDWVVVQGVHRRGLAIRRIGTMHWISPEGALLSHLHGQAEPDLQRLHASMLERLNPPALAS